MFPTATTIQGTVKPDGTLQLDEPLTLSPGRVIVTVQALPAPGTDPFWDAMERVWAIGKESGWTPRTKEQIDAEVRQFGDEMEEEFEATERLQEECRRARDQATRPGEGG